MSAPNKLTLDPGGVRVFSSVALVHPGCTPPLFFFLCRCGVRWIGAMRLKGFAPLGGWQPFLDSRFFHSSAGPPDLLVAMLAGATAELPGLLRRLAAHPTATRSPAAPSRRCHSAGTQVRSSVSQAFLKLSRLLTRRSERWLLVHLCSVISPSRLW